MLKGGAFRGVKGWVGHLEVLKGGGAFRSVIIRGYKGSGRCLIHYGRFKRNILIFGLPRAASIITLPCSHTHTHNSSQ